MATRPRLITSRTAAPTAAVQRARILAASKVSYQTDARGRYRVFNSAVYRFYRSSTAPPEEGDEPFATNATLPYTPADTYADGTWYLSMSRFNGIYDSGFLPLGPTGETYLRLDLSGGVEVNSPPAGPLQWHIENTGGGVVRIIAVYLESGTLRAEQWAIGRTFDGSTPAADTPDETVTMPTSGLAVLQHDLAAQADGTTVNVRLQTRRFDSSYIYSEDSEVKTITADALGPAAVQAFTGATHSTSEGV